MATTRPGVAKARGFARRFAMQAIYQWQMTGDETAGIKQQYIDDNDMYGEESTVDVEYFDELVEGVFNSAEAIDTLLEKYMDRKAAEVDPVERAILRVATFEFTDRLDVPYRVVLNEAVALTKKFCAEKSHTFINAVLDKVAHEVRELEIKAHTKS